MSRSSTASSRRACGAGSRPCDGRREGDGPAAPRRLVVDANVVVAAFLRDSAVRRLLTLSVMKLFASEFLMTELGDHLSEFPRRAGISEAAAREVIEKLGRYIDVVPTEVSLSQWDRAVVAVGSIDPGDVAYVATALSIPCDGIWSDDVDLKRQGAVPCWTTRDLVAALRKEGFAF